MRNITIDDVLKKFLDRSPGAKVYQVGGIVIDYSISEDKFYLTTSTTRGMPFDEVVDFFKKEYKRHEEFYTEDYKNSSPFRN
jgi:hypothetical protein